MSNYLRKKKQAMFEEASSFRDFFQMPFLKQDIFLKTDVLESKDSYTLIVDIPGCNKDDVKISNEDGYLTIEVNNSKQNETSGSNYLKRERIYGKYSRSYYIGNNVEAKSINASFTNGLLKINFPKEKQLSNTTYIPIKDN